MKKILLFIFFVSNYLMMYSQYELKDLTKDTLYYSNINIELFYPNNSYKLNRRLSLSPAKR